MHDGGCSRQRHQPGRSAARDRGRGSRLCSTATACSRAALLARGRVRFLEQHLRRLALGCERLGIVAPDPAAAAFGCAAAQRVRGTRVCSRSSSRAASAHAVIGRRRAARRRGSSRCIRAPAAACDAAGAALVRNASRTQCPLGGHQASQPPRAGAGAGEWRRRDDRRRLDARHRRRVVSGTASNVFLVREGMLVTPDLRFCGVLGVMRAASAADGEGAGHRSQRRAAVAAGSGSGERSLHHECRARHPLGDRARRSALEPSAPVADRLRRGVGTLMRRLLRILVLLVILAAIGAGAIAWWSNQWLQQPIAGLHRDDDVRSAARRQSLRSVATRLECARACWISRRSGSRGRVSRDATAR